MKVKIFLLYTIISIDCWLLQNCWQPNFIHIMSRSPSQKFCKVHSQCHSRSQKIWEASRSWTFYLQLYNPGYSFCDITTCRYRTNDTDNLYDVIIMKYCKAIML